MNIICPIHRLTMSDCVDMTNTSEDIWSQRQGLKTVPFSQLGTVKKNSLVIVMVQHNAMCFLTRYNCEANTEGPKCTKIIQNPRPCTCDCRYVGWDLSMHVQCNECASNFPRQSQNLPESKPVPKRHEADLDLWKCQMFCLSPTIYTQPRLNSRLTQIDHARSVTLQNGSQLHLEFSKSSLRKAPPALMLPFGAIGRYKFKKQSHLLKNIEKEPQKQASLKCITYTYMLIHDSLSG